MLKTMGLIAVATICIGYVDRCDAQTSSLTLYGSIDEGIGYVSNQNGGKAVVMGPIAVPDKFGFVGSEDLGGGLSAIFKLENGYFSNTGRFAISGYEFSRLAYVGLASQQWGTLTLGRQWDLTNDVFTPNANGAVQFNNFMYHPGNIDNAAVTPLSNSVKYASPGYRGFGIRTMYSFSDASTALGRYIGAAALYASGPLQLGAVYSDTNHRTYAFNTQLGYTSFMGQNLAGGASFVADNTRIIGVAGTYKLGDRWRIHGMIDQAHLQTRQDTETALTEELGVDYQASIANTVSLGGFHTGFAGKGYTTVGLANLYQLSKRTLAYAEVTFQKTNGGALADLPSLSPSSNDHQLSLRMGLQHYF
ncbi:porin [Caballeronia udeis]|uniref:Porin n=1 Tax=Caballeronia udeis TaxID=1232866 RepID=A0A158JJ21_9BURK|nr:porin [Caballeronia udeis]SAL68824.1 porin [Caballeronia udeis]